MRRDGRAFAQLRALSISTMLMPSLSFMRVTTCSWPAARSVIFSSNLSDQVRAGFG